MNTCQYLQVVDLSMSVMYDECGSCEEYGMSELRGQQKALFTRVSFVVMTNVLLVCFF